LTIDSNVLEEQFGWNLLTSTEKDQVIQEILGPRQRHEHYVLIFVTSFYSTTIVVGVIGNLITTWAIKTTPDLQTPSNYFILNLAVVDFVTLVFGKCICSTNYNKIIRSNQI
jgi:hypothetical protein